LICDGCGNVNHTRDECRLRTTHPEFNVNGPWKGSSAQKRCKKKGCQHLPTAKLISGESFDKFDSEKAERIANYKKRTEEVQNKDTSRGNRGHRRNNRGELLDRIISTINPYDPVHRENGNAKKVGMFSNIQSDNPTKNEEFIMTFIKLQCDANNHTLTVSTLIDNGALQRNYISEEAMKRIRATEEGSDKACTCKVIKTNSLTCSGLNGFCKSSLGVLTLDWIFLNELTNEYEKHALEFAIIDTMYDIIIGKPTIKKLSLVFKLPSQFVSDSDKEKLLQIVPAVNNAAEYFSSAHSSRQPFPSGATEIGNISHNMHSDLCPKTVTQLSIIEERKNIRELIDYEPDDDGIDDRYVEPSWNNVVSQERAVDLVGIHGPPELQQRLRELINEYDEVFCETVKPKPARIPPMEIEIDQSKWKKNCNRGPPRPVSAPKEQEIRRQIDKMLELKIIETSTATEYSQILLTPKPDGKWRFCIDFRRANDASEGRAWPIPIIMQMLQRIGQQKPKWFAKMDMTSGYHQAPLAENSRYITAFICFLGILQWLRVPMGLKGAGAYFQQMMAPWSL
jgi:hypothetical protein